MTKDIWEICKKKSGDRLAIAPSTLSVLLFSPWLKFIIRSGKDIWKRPDVHTLVNEEGDVPSIMTLLKPKPLESYLEYPWRRTHHQSIMNEQAILGRAA